MRARRRRRRPSTWRNTSWSTTRRRLWGWINSPTLSSSLILYEVWRLLSSIVRLLGHSSLRRCAGLRLDSQWDFSDGTDGHSQYIHISFHNQLEPTFELGSYEHAQYFKRRAENVWIVVWGHEYRRWRTIYPPQTSTRSSRKRRNMKSFISSTGMGQFKY